MTRSLAIALLVLLAAGAGCGSCLDDNQNPPPSPGPVKIPPGVGNLRRADKPLPRVTLMGADAAGQEGADADAGAVAD